MPGLLTRLANAWLTPTLDRLVQQRLREAVPSGRFDDEDQGWTRLTGTRRDLSPLKQDRMIEVCHYLYDQNPLAKWLLDVERDFVLGEGATVHAEDEDVQRVLTAWWDDPINHLDLHLPQMVLELSLYGEALWPVFVNEQTGLVRLATVDPSRIKTVHHDPDNAAVPIGMTLKGRAGHGGKRLRVLYPAPDEALFASAALQQRLEEFIDGDCFWFKLNAVRTATRGRSDLFALGDWIDGYEQFLFNTLDRTAFLNAFVWDVVLKGMDAGQIRAWQNDNPPPKPGSVFAHNENIEMHAVTPNLQGADTAEQARLFRNQILGGKGVPTHWFGGADDANLATAMGAPTFKRFGARQRLIRYIVTFMGRYQLDQAMAAGDLSPTADRAFQVVLPQLQAEDLSRIGPALQSLTNAAAIAEDRGWITPGTAQQLFAAVASRLGVDVPLTEPTEAEASSQVTRDYRRNGSSPVARNGQHPEEE